MTDRIFGCLKGVATGDAIGKQTEMLDRDDIRRWYPHGVRGFEGPPGAIIPRYEHNRKREWRIGETTDDTERTIAVARAVLADNAVRHSTVGREMLTCTKCVHPGLQSLWEFHQANDPDRVAQRHEGCGAAVRMAPVGIIYRSDRLDEIIAASREAAISTHGGPLALAAAAATAAAISAAIDGQSSAAIFRLAERAAAETEIQQENSRRMADAMCDVREALSRLRGLAPDDVAADCFPDAPLTIVPLALAIATLVDSAEAAMLLAANVGGDSDSVASIAGAIVGARHPGTINEEWYAVVESVNRHDLGAIARALAERRR